MVMRIVRTVPMSQIASKTAPFRQHASQTSSGARNRANVSQMPGAVTATKIATMRAMRRIARRRNAIRGCSHVAMDDAFTIPGCAVSSDQFASM